MGTKNFSNANDLITFSRASGGTALRKVAYGSELVTNGTFDTDSDWGRSSGATIGDGVATITVTSGGFEYIAQNISFVSGKVYSVTATITGAAAVGSFRVVDNANNLGGLTASATATSLTGSPQTVTFTWAANVNSSTLLVGRNTTSGDYSFTIDNVSVKEVLFDQGTLTLFNHPADIPRIEYDADGNVLGLLVEESRTNLVTYSEDFSLSPWSRVNVFITSDAAAGPDGVSSADLLVASVVSSQHRLDLIPTSSAGTQTFSVYLKPDGYSDVWLRIGAIGSGFNLTDGSTFTTNAGITATAQEVGNGWYRCSITTTSAAANATVRINVLGSSSVADFAGDGTSGIYIYGAQLEAGAFPTSYIPTSGSTATRAADVASIPVSAFGYNQSEGTVVVEVNIPTTSASGILVAIWDGDTSDAYYSYTEGTSNLFLRGREGGSTFSTISRSPLSSGVSKHAFAYDSSSNQLVLNGGSVASGSGQIIEAANTLAISPGFQRSHFKSIKYYPRRLTNAQIVELTS